VEGWNQNSGAALAAVLTDDGDLVGFDGQHLTGRAEIAPFHQGLFDNWLKGTRLVGKVEDLRFLSPDVALIHAIDGTVMRGKSEPSPERDSIQTLVVTRQEGEWRLAAFQNIAVRAPADARVRRDAHQRGAGCSEGSRRSRQGHAGHRQALQGVSSLKLSGTKGKGTPGERSSSLCEARTAPQITGSR
jgi:uncharacterized protein (TIGR02246 family)